MAKLTDTQLILLTKAAQRPDSGVVAITDRAPLTRLVKAGLLTLVPKTANLALWQTSKDGTPQSLVLSDLGRDAIGLEETSLKDAPVIPVAAKASKKTTSAKAKLVPPSRKAQSSKAMTATKKPGGKLAVLVTLLSRAKGAGLEEMTKATGWQPHSVRGAISGALKKKRGLNVLSEAGAKGRIYRIAH